MNKLFEQRMQKLLQNDYPAFESALNQKPIKSFYLNPLKHGSIEHLNSAFLTNIPTSMMLIFMIMKIIS